MDAKNDAKSGETSRDPAEDAAPAEAAATEPSVTSKEPKEREAQGKRRLGMMPEVLPAPSNHPLQGSPRQRTVRTMERLLAAATATALLASCSNNHGGGAGGAGAGGAGASGASSSSGGGYGVVDPLPPPARCEGVAATSPATAVWKDAMDGSGLIIELQLPKPGRTDASYEEQTPPLLSGATLVSSTNTAGALTLELAPAAGALVDVNLGVTCAAGPGRLEIVLDAEKASTPTAGDPVALVINDAY